MDFAFTCEWLGFVCMVMWLWIGGEVFGMWEGGWKGDVFFLDFFLLDSEDWMLGNFFLK